jgi:TrmH family RNA methyltransferase
LQTNRGRKKSGLFLMEGPHLLEALLNAGVLPQEIYLQPELLQRTADGRALLERLRHTDGMDQEQIVEVNEHVITAISDTHTSQGVISVLPLAAFTAQEAEQRRMTGQIGLSRASTASPVRRPALLILDDLSDPGNMGTILRTALAADVAMVLLTAKCVDCFNPKVVRAAAGAHIALPIERDLSWEAITEHVTHHSPSRVLLAEAHSSQTCYEHDLTQPFALVIGSEAHGPSEAARALATLGVMIPLNNAVESLNAAMATGIILYEALRQRSGK